MDAAEVALLSDGKSEEVGSGFTQEEGRPASPGRAPPTPTSRFPESPVTHPWGLKGAIS